MDLYVDHLVVGAADLDVGVKWVEDRIGGAPVFGGVHDGFGTSTPLFFIDWKGCPRPVRPA